MTIQDEIMLERQVYKLQLENEGLRKANEELRNAIREHRDQKADDRCIEDDKRLYAVLRDGNLGDFRVGNKEEMLKNCARFIDKRCEEGGWPTYQELEQRIIDLEYVIENMTKE